MSHNATSLTRLQQLGLDLNNPADRTLLTSRIDSALAASRGFKAPWQRELALGSGGNPSAGGGPTNNVFDRAAQKGLAANSQPYIFVTSFNYITPRPSGRVLGALLGDWTVAGLLRTRAAR